MFGARPSSTSMFVDACLKGALRDINSSPAHHHAQFTFTSNVPRFDDVHRLKVRGLSRFIASSM